MKKTILMLAMVPLLFWVGTSCEDEPRGPLVKDSTPPEPISQETVRVKNLPGGAQITYDIPADEDLLYVEVRYKRNEKLVVTRSSVYKDTLLVEGLYSTEPQEVELLTVDRSENRSTPVKVTITPREPPLSQMFKSFEMETGFGGPLLRYENPEEIKTEILLHTVDEQGTEIYKQSAFLSGKELRKIHIFRDTAFQEKTLKFAIHAMDRWGNRTETKQASVLSLKEDKLEGARMRAVRLVGDQPAALGWVMRNLFDGRKDFGATGFSTPEGAPGKIVPPYTEPYHLFTFDMGVLAKLSRVVWWNRMHPNKTIFTFNQRTPQYFEIWGIDRLPEDDGASMAPGSGWVRLIENGELIKPSGLPLGQVSAEDVTAEENGHEFAIPVDKPPVRYVRFVNFRTFDGILNVDLHEFECYGSSVENK